MSNSMKIHIRGTSETSRFVEHVETMTARRAVDGFIKIPAEQYHQVVAHLLAAVASAGSVEMDDAALMKDGDEEAASRFVVIHTATANMIQSLVRLGISQPEAVAATEALLRDGREQASNRQKRS